MAKNQADNMAKIAIIGIKWADYTSKKSQKPVKGWFVNYLVPAWRKLPDGVQELYFESESVKIEPENMVGNPTIGVYHVEMAEQEIFTQFGKAFVRKPKKIFEKVENLNLNLL